MKRLVAALLAAALLTLPAQAHFIWMSPTGNNNVSIVFSDDTSPDTNVAVTKIAATKVFLRASETEKLLTPKLDKDQYLVEVTTNKTGTAGGSCLYGVLLKGDAEPFLLNYHAKTILGSDPVELALEASKTWNKLPLDVVVSSLGKGKDLQGRLLWHGKPAAKCEVIVESPGNKRATVETDPEGLFPIAASKKEGSLILIRGKLVEEKAGKLEGKDYKSSRHYVTLTVPSSIGEAVVEIKPANANQEEKKRGGEKTADPAVTKLLKDARNARALWSSFPGFTADLAVNHNGRITKTKLTVQDNGKVDLDIADEAMKKFVRNQIISLVAHRMGNASEKETPCAFADKDDNHPLGRKILVLNDELHSSYRIKDDQIIEVNRQMKESGTNFTITVLKNYVTAEKKFLPAYYVVNTWKSDSSQLLSSTTHHHTWKRVGKYDLPETLTIVTAKGISPLAAASVGAAENNVALDAWTFTFSNVDLLPSK